MSGLDAQAGERRDECTAADVLEADTQASMLPRLTRFSKYFTADCIAT